MLMLFRSRRSQPPPPSKVKVVQEQVDEVVGIMQSNIEKVIERGDKLDQLQDKTGATVSRQ